MWEFFKKCFIELKEDGTSTNLHKKMYFHKIVYFEDRQ